MFDSLMRDARDALRSVRRSPGFSALVILILAAGIGANVAMFSVTNAALLKALPFPNPDRLVMGRTTWNGRLGPSVAVPDFMDYRDRSNAFESLGTILGASFGFAITGTQEPEWAEGTLVSVNLFRTLGVSPQVGRDFTEDEGEPDAPLVAMISDGYWQRRFGGTGDVVGSILTIDGDPFTIVGVLPAGFHLLHDVDLWLPMRERGSRASHSWLLVGRLGRAVSIEEAQSRVDVISAQLADAFPETNENKALLLTDLRAALGEQYRLGLMLLLGAIGLVLLIACANVASLLLARSSTRRVELSVRAALGASRGRLARQLLAESLVLAICAALLGFVIALWLQNLILALLPLDRLGIHTVGVSLPMLLFTLGLSIGTALAFGGFPALSSSRTNPAQQLHGAIRSSAEGSSSRLRSSLVVAQVTLSFVLLIAAGLLLRSFAHLGEVDLGFETENLLTARVRLPMSKYRDAASRSQFFEGLLEDIRAIPGVRGAGAINKLPIKSPWMNWGVWNPEDPPPDYNERPFGYARYVLPGYFDTMGIPLLAGRDVADTDVEGVQPVLVISESLARALYPGQDPVGREIVVEVRAVEPTTLQVIGVVGNARVNTVAQDGGLQFYFSHNQAMGDPAMSIVVRTLADPASYAAPVLSALKARDPGVPLADAVTMDQIVSDAMSANKVLNVILSLFAGTALLLAAVGLYGVLAYQVAQRVHEIGIRMALGAPVKCVLEIVFRKGLLLVAMGVAFGLAAALWATRVLQQQLYEIEPTDPATYVGAVICFGLVGTLACLVPAVRAVRIDPVAAFREN